MSKIIPTKTPKLKNHILPKGKLLSTTLDRKFGVTLADFDRAINGDIAAAQKIGELARQGRLSHRKLRCRHSHENYLSRSGAIKYITESKRREK